MFKCLKQRTYLFKYSNSVEVHGQLNLVILKPSARLTDKVIYFIMCLNQSIT